MPPTASRAPCPLSLPRGVSCAPRLNVHIGGTCLPGWEAQAPALSPRTQSDPPMPLELEREAVNSNPPPPSPALLPTKRPTRTHLPKGPHHKEQGCHQGAQHGWRVRGAPSVPGRQSCGSSAVGSGQPRTERCRLRQPEAKPLNELTARAPPAEVIVQCPFAPLIAEFLQHNISGVPEKANPLLCRRRDRGCPPTCSPGTSSARQLLGLQSPRSRKAQPGWRWGVLRAAPARCAS